MTENESLMVRNNRIADIFKCIKRLTQEYLDQGYPAAPDPDQYIDLISDQVDMYCKLKQDD